MIATLTYHAIADISSPISVSGATFDDHLRWLTSGRVRVLPLDSLVREPADAPDAVAITFDDGFRNIKTPVERLVAHGITPTIFAVTGHAGGTNAWGGRDQAGIPTLPLLDWDELEGLHRLGTRIEAHTRTHPRLTTLPPAQVDDEILGCLSDLEARLGSRPSHFAYPYGDLNPDVADLAHSRFSYSHTTEMGAHRPTNSTARLPRLDMYYFQSPNALESFGTPGFARRVAWIRARRAIKGLVLR